MVRAPWFFAFVVLLVPLHGERVTVPLDGTWQIDESVSADDRPAGFTHTAPVPGLANLASPPFADVDRFDSRELIENRVRRKMLPESARVQTVGIPHQARNYFWYRRAFRVQARKQTAILRINKAQFGTAVWLNGVKLGEHFGCFTASYFDATKAVRWNAENDLVVRVGAHPAALPASVPAGTDFEKLKWTPGIYDSVSFQLADNPVIETVQVAPDIHTSSILVETAVRSYGAATKTPLKFAVRTWPDKRLVAESGVPVVSVAANGTASVQTRIRIPGAQLWSPERPFLYTLEASTSGDGATTRFGMREFRFDTPTRRAYLNGRPYFMRGSNITLHRFFEDPNCGRLPWDRAWVRKLLVDIPKKMH
jgi:beta-galactosidase/beta-glucuronidase